MLTRKQIQQATRLALETGDPSGILGSTRFPCTPARKVTDPSNKEEPSIRFVLDAQGTLSFTHSKNKPV
jgi:plastocyanin domain-containing protein